MSLEHELAQANKAATIFAETLHSILIHIGALDADDQEVDDASIIAAANKWIEQGQEQ